MCFYQLGKPGQQITRFSSPIQKVFNSYIRMSFIVYSLQILLENYLPLLRYDFFSEIKHILRNWPFAPYFLRAH